MEQHREARLSTSFRVLFSLARGDVYGTLVDLSRTGAQVETAPDRIPEIGAQVQLSIAGSRDRRIEVAARVMRHTARGFGAQFLGATPVEVLELLEDLGG